jgi:hypothetical protein
LDICGNFSTTFATWVSIQSKPREKTRRVKHAARYLFVEMALLWNVTDSSMLSAMLATVPHQQNFAFNLIIPDQSNQIDAGPIALFFINL